MFDIGDDELPNFNRDYNKSQYKDPYKPISRMECHKGLNAAHLSFRNMTSELTLDPSGIDDVSTVSAVRDHQITHFGGLNNANLWYV